MDDEERGIEVALGEAKELSRQLNIPVDFVLSDALKCYTNMLKEECRLLMRSRGIPVPFVEFLNHFRLSKRDGWAPVEAMILAELEGQMPSGRKAAPQEAG